MSCNHHKDHNHQHGAGCGHKAIQHGDHVDYLHDNHLHHVHGDHIDEHSLCDDSANKSSCTPEHKCGGHDAGHKHGDGCGHDAIPHGDHVDYLVGDHLHCPCGSHCDDHGKVSVK